MAFESFVSLWRWWRAELASLVPAGDPRRAVSRIATAELFAGAEDARVFRRPRLTAPLAAPAARAASIDAAVAALKRGDRTILTFDESHCLLRRKAIPAATLARAGQILDLELARATPFARGDVISGWYPDSAPETGGQRMVTHVIMRRDLVAAAAAKISARGAKPVAIAMRVDAGPAAPVVFDASGAPFGLKQQSRWLKRAAFAGGLMLVMAAAAAGFVLERQRAGLAELEAAVEELRKPALEVRKKVENEAAARRQSLNLSDLRGSGVPALAIWEELSRLLPDGAWLQNLAIDDGGVLVDGAALKAEELIAILEDSPLFKNVQFVSPVYKGPDEAKARFSIRFAIEAKAP